MIAVVDGDRPDLLAHLAELRTAGAVPLVTDPRWSAEQLAAVRRTAERAEMPDDTAWAALTSGSSGAPRIVLRSARSWAESFAAVAGFLDAGPDAAVALPAPPAASITLFSLAHALAGGPRPARDDFSEATCFHGTPEALRALLDRGAPPTLRAALVGGSHLDPALRARAESAGIRVVSYYGAAELSFVAVDEGDGLRAFPGVDVEVRDGEVWVRSGFAASGYLGDGGPLRRDGAWASVGDRAEMRDGRLVLRGRADEAILTASATVIPDEVERALRSIPGVRDAVVFGMPHPGVGALVAAFVELDDSSVGGAPTSGAVPESLRAAVARGLGPAHRPRRWVMGALPRTPSGKPARADAVRLATEVLDRGARRA